MALTSLLRVTISSRGVVADVMQDVFTMDANGYRVTAVTSNRSLNILPSLGPGGGVLFTSYAKRNPDPWLYRDGRRVRISQRPGLNLGGVWSPDGRSIAVALSAAQRVRRANPCGPQLRYVPR